MPMRWADYARIADRYDTGRALSEENLKSWILLISRMMGSREGVDFLDLGCGTGRFSIPIAKTLGYTVTGADSSEEMLDKARRKDGGDLVKWDPQDAGASYPDESYDAVFMSHLLHHVRDPPSVVGECYRVLRPGGLVLSRYGALQDIKDDPEHRFFPEALKIDEARTPTIGKMEEWISSAGFIEVSSTTVQQQTNATPRQRLERVRLRSTSVLTLITQPAYEQDMKDMERYVLDNPEDPWLLSDRITLTTGRKPLPTP